MDKFTASSGIFNPIFIVSWFGATLTTLIFAILFSIHIQNPKIIQQTSPNFNLYAALPEDNMAVSESIEKQDGRVVIISNFFKKYNAPLQNFGEIFVKTADKYQIDYRLLPAIAMQESNGGKKIIKDSNNPFGYGIYGKNVKKFSSFEEAIDRVGQGLREDYLNLGLTTPEKIMPKYTPPSAALGGPWAKGVTTFMEELR